MPGDVPTLGAVHVARGGDGKIVVDWSGSAKPHEVSYMVSVLGTAVKCVTVETSCVVSGLVNGRGYRVVVRASNDVGLLVSDVSNMVVPAVRAVAPVVGVAGVSSVHVSWSAPVYDGGSPVSGYAVKAYPGGQSCVTAGETVR